MDQFFFDLFRDIAQDWLFSSTDSYIGATLIGNFFGDPFLKNGIVISVKGDTSVLLGVEGGHRNLKLCYFIIFHAITSIDY